MIPDSCQVNPLEGTYSEFVIEKMDDPLEMDIVHGDKNRKYFPTVYKISKDGSDKVSLK